MPQKKLMFPLSHSLLIFFSSLATPDPTGIQLGCIFFFFSLFSFFSFSVSVSFCACGGLCVFSCFLVWEVPAWNGQVDTCRTPPMQQCDFPSHVNPVIDHWSSRGYFQTHALIHIFRSYLTIGLIWIGRLKRVTALQHIELVARKHWLRAAASPCLIRIRESECNAMDNIYICECYQTPLSTGQSFTSYIGDYTSLHGLSTFA